MISTIFRKSTPVNYSLVLFLFLFFFFFYEISEDSRMNTVLLILEKTFTFLILVCTIFIASHIAKENDLTKDSTYAVLFYFLLILFFPTIFDNLNIVLANLFILLALRRLLSLKDLKASKEKIFDASLWIFVASLFYFWSILFLGLVFISIFFHGAKDYRNFILPVIAFLAVAMILLFFSLFFEIDFDEYLQRNVRVSSELDYFVTSSQHIVFSIYVSVALFFVSSMVFTLSGRSSITRGSFKKMLVAFFIGVIVFLISNNKTNDLLTLTFPSLAIMISAYFEYIQDRLKLDIVAWVFIICSLCTFFIQV